MKNVSERFSSFGSGRFSQHRPQARAGCKLLEDVEKRAEDHKSGGKVNIGVEVMIGGNTVIDLVESDDEAPPAKMMKK